MNSRIKKFGLFLFIIFFLFLIIGSIVRAIINSQDKDVVKENVAITPTPIGSDGNYFYTDEWGNTYAYGDSTMTSEDVVYAYIKALALLDFSTAQRYVSTTSYVMSGFESRDSNNTGMASGYSIVYNFTHKIYKKLLTSLKVVNIVDTVVMPDYYIITLNVEHLDFNNNEFWKNDRDTIFSTLYTLYLEENTESANAKVNEYLSSYIKDYYESDEAPKTITEIELKLVKSISQAWVIDNDLDLYSLCSYNDGQYSINTIKSEYSDWYQDMLIKKNESLMDNTEENTEENVEVDVEENNN